MTSVTVSSTVEPETAIEVMGFVFPSVIDVKSDAAAVE